MKTVNENNYYTLYWHNGDRNIVTGKTIVEAFTAAGYGAGAIHALDWYDEGVTEAHYYDKQMSTWVKYEPIHLHFNDVDWSDPGLAAELTTLLNKHHTIIVELENKDQYSISFNYGNYYSVGWVKTLTIAYGEYYEGSYTEDGDEDHHFMMTQSEYFDPNNTHAVIAAFIQRSKCPYRASNSKEAKRVDRLPRL